MLELVREGLIHLIYAPYSGNIWDIIMASCNNYRIKRLLPPIVMVLPSVFLTRLPQSQHPFIAKFLSLFNRSAERQQVPIVLEPVFKVASNDLPWSRGVVRSISYN